jgi:hypothetical protein
MSRRLCPDRPGQAQRAILTNMHIDIDYAKLAAEPGRVDPPATA